jgi:hypothetical protein
MIEFTREKSWSVWVSFVTDASGGGDDVWGDELQIPPWDDALAGCWATLRFGALHGAPLTPHAEAFLERRRACAQEVVRCFHAARWRAAAGRRSSVKWRAMSAVPDEVLMIILELAEVEIREALH